MTPEDSSPPRKLRCRVLDRKANRCPNPELTGFGFCLHHLAEAHAEYEAVKAEAIANPKQTHSNLPSRTLATSSRESHETLRRSS